MFEASGIREWRGHDVVDVNGHKIGTLESVYVDTVTDQPSFATVTVGLPTRRRPVFVPLSGASVGPGYLKVARPKSQVKHAPAIDIDGELPAGDEAAVFAHYELDPAPGGGRGTPFGAPVGPRQTTEEAEDDTRAVPDHRGGRARHRRCRRQGPAVPAVHRHRRPGPRPGRLRRPVPERRPIPNR